MGIRKIHDAEELWRRLDELGDRQSFFLLERFRPIKDAPTAPPGR